MATYYNDSTATGMVKIMKLNQAISTRLMELLNERQMTQYQLYIRSGVPKSTIGAYAAEIERQNRRS